MSYCVNCGVKLSESEKKCPLCQTEVINPNQKSIKYIEKPYPDNLAEFNKISNRIKSILITICFMLPIIICLLCNYNISDSITWSKFVVTSLLFVYSVVIYSLLCCERNNRLFNIVVYHVLLTTFMYVMNSLCKANWFLTFVIPIVSISLIFFVIIYFIFVRANFSKLKCAALIVFSIGIFCVFLELITNFAFELRKVLIWSYYPCITLTIISILFCIIDSNRTIKEQLEKKLFL